MSRHPMDHLRRPAEARLARYLEIERRERVHGRHPAIDALHRRAAPEALHHPRAEAAPSRRGIEGAART